MKVTEDELIKWLNDGIEDHERVISTLNNAGIKNDLVAGSSFGRIEAYRDILNLIETGFDKTYPWKVCKHDEKND